MKLINEIKNNSGLVVSEAKNEHSPLSISIATRFWKESNLDYDPDKDVKKLARIIDDARMFRAPIRDIALVAAKRFWKEINLDYDSDKDVKKLAAMIEEGIKANKKTNQQKDLPIVTSKLAMEAATRFWKEINLDYDPDKDVKKLARIIDETIAKYK